MSEARIDLLTDQLRQRIQSGEFGTGGRLPPHRALAVQLRTSRETTNKVLQHLLAEGLLVSQGRSIYVAPPRVRLPGIISHYHRYMQEQGVLPISAFLDVPRRDVAAAVTAHFMHLEEGTPIVHRILRQGIQRGTECIWYRILDNFFPADLIDESILRAMQAEPAFDVLQAIHETTGKVVVKAHNEVIARLPTAIEQQHLEVVRTTPMMDIVRVQLSRDEQVLALSRLCLIGSLFTLSFDVDATF